MSVTFNMKHQPNISSVSQVRRKTSDHEDAEGQRRGASSDFIVMNKATASSLAALQEDIRGAVETLDRIDEFLLPNESPDNSGLGFNMCAEAR
jgi:hypothetical protein